jgi:membrane glycosyltransferase
MAEEGRLPLAALGFAIAAALSSWTPLAAPFGIVVGLGAVVLSVRALRSGARRRAALVAVAVAGLAIVSSVLVLALTAGVGRELRGTPVVLTPGGADAASELDEAAQRTRAARERARAELEKLGAPVDGKRAEDPEGGEAGRREELHR